MTLKLSPLPVSSVLSVVRCRCRTPPDSTKCVLETNCMRFR